MILSAVSLWKKLDMSNELNPTESPLGKSAFGEKSCRIAFNGRKVDDGEVRISAVFSRPVQGEKFPVVLLLGDAGKRADSELVTYFVQKGYGVLAPDYSGYREVAEDEETWEETQEEIADVEQMQIELGEELPVDKQADVQEEKDEKVNSILPYTVYPDSLSHANFVTAGGLTELEERNADQSCWFEWMHVVMYAIKYLKSRDDVTSIGVVGIRAGGALTWKSMLSEDVQCGVPINAVGWDSFKSVNKFLESTQKNLSNERHRYIAGIESQSYANFAKCPVLMLCAMRDGSFDCDRAYDTYARVGCTDGSAIVYSTDSGPCIGPTALFDMDLFLEKNLKGRAIFIPESLNVSLKEENGEFLVEAEVDEGGILEEAGIFYAEGDENTKSVFRNWQCVYKVEGKNVKNGKIETRITPFEGAKFVFAYAYARYINGFQVVSKIAGKRFAEAKEDVVKDRMIFDGTGLECFDVYEFEEYSLGGIFLENEALPKLSVGYGGIKGAYSVSGIKTYKISSPRFLPDESAMLKFDLYAVKDDQMQVSVDVEKDGEVQTYVSKVSVKGGGKWKRILLKPAEFKEEETGVPLKSFLDGNALSFRIGDEENEFAVTNILWL